MSAILEFLQNAVITVSRFGKQIFNLVGIFFLFYTGIHCIFIWIKEKDEVADDLFEGISTALTFLLIGEIFHSIILTDLSEIWHLAAIVGLRAAMTVLLHWEKTQKNKH